MPGCSGTEIRGRLVTRYAAGGLLNSVHDRTWYLGAAWALRTGSHAGYVDAGLFVGAVTYPSSGEPILPAVLPMLSLGGHRVGVNLIYIPRLRGKTVPTYFAQLTLAIP